jgi:AcrR family transcriptional regulator
MEYAITANSNLSARKKPSQNRSQKMVLRILDAARKILRETGGASSSRITTNHIARKAGVSVGSLYQYFPNTEAILFELYKEMLSPIQDVMGEFESVAFLSLPKETFFDKLNRALTSSGPDSEFVFAMRNATKAYPMLAEADRKHAEFIAKRIATFLKHYGSEWPLKKLQRLALFVYYIDDGTWTYRDHARPPKKEAFDWELNALNFVFMQCFE